MYRPLNDDGTNGVDDDDDDDYGMDDVGDNLHDTEMVGMSIIGIEDTENVSLGHFLFFYKRQFCTNDFFFVRTIL